MSGFKNKRMFACLVLLFALLRFVFCFHFNFTGFLSARADELNFFPRGLHSHSCHLVKRAQIETAAWSQRNARTNCLTIVGQIAAKWNIERGAGCKGNSESTEICTCLAKNFHVPLLRYTKRGQHVIVSCMGEDLAALSTHQSLLSTLQTLQYTLYTPYRLSTIHSNYTLFSLHFKL